MRKLLLVGNWKMNLLLSGSDFSEQNYIEDLTLDLKENIDLVLLPPYTHLGLLNALTDDRIEIGSQDVSVYSKGAYTGEVSVDCLLSVGASYVLLCHSECRINHKDTNDLVNRKAKLSLDSGLNVIVCIGESLEEKQSGRTLEVLYSQLDESLPTDIDYTKVVLAYEPLWSIGSGKIPSLEDIDNIHISLREHIKRSRGEKVGDEMRILYGGSVKSNNSESILSLKDVDGVLVGGASLDSQEFVKIIKSL